MSNRDKVEEVRAYDDLYQWIWQFRKILEGNKSHQNHSLPISEKYIDLSKAVFIEDPDLLGKIELPQLDSVTVAFEHLLVAMAEHRWVRVRYGINEFLKVYLYHLLKSSSSEEAKKETKRYLSVIRYIFEYGLSPAFPYTESLWSYLSACLESTGMTLARHDRWDAVEVLLIETANMGRHAAREGLQTAPLQHFLRRLENHCRHHGNDEKIASLARNLRFNLEV
ncbi:hypothetical protein F9B85_08760 [Heliorestis acidaminivorans]|uniref:Uncharacterized protein n=1 Tax=Heliorestis acidaminivorans TaxID=553427 RepID=A0A6I0EU75_9FIRM|nr:hypothetical protein [Heliorestis acidaminivorans]KAB2952730.1 hypothetical protein F9B85_08760 [Heliorestis acidaminivorans]